LSSSIDGEGGVEMDMDLWMPKVSDHLFEKPEELTYQGQYTKYRMVE
jgi:hypothetical protein